MHSGCNCCVEKLYFLPNDVELMVTKSWCYSVISSLEKIELCEDLICLINTRIYDSECDDNLYSEIGNNYVKMSVGNIKKIIDICGKETLCYILPYNYEKLSFDFLCNTLGELKNQIENFVDLEKYDDALCLINNVNNIYLKRIALIYMKYIYMIQTEKKITFFKRTRKLFVNKIDSIIKRISDNY